VTNWRLVAFVVASLDEMSSVATEFRAGPG
jgi:hypothetical protein